MNSDINEEINLNPSVVIKKIKFNDNTEIELIMWEKAER